jgi:hypothetical protein
MYMSCCRNCAVNTTATQLRIDALQLIRPHHRQIHYPRLCMRIRASAITHPPTAHYKLWLRLGLPEQRPCSNRQVPATSRCGPTAQRARTQMELERQVSEQDAVPPQSIPPPAVRLVFSDERIRKLTSMNAIQIPGRCDKPSWRNAQRTPGSRCTNGRPGLTR